MRRCSNYPRIRWNCFAQPVQDSRHRDHRRVLSLLWNKRHGRVPSCALHVRRRRRGSSRRVGDLERHRMRRIAATRVRDQQRLDVLEEDRVHERVVHARALPHVLVAFLLVVLGRAAAAVAARGDGRTGDAGRRGAALRRVDVHELRERVRVKQERVHGRRRHCVATGGGTALASPHFARCLLASG